MYPTDRPTNLPAVLAIFGRSFGPTNHIYIDEYKYLEKNDTEKYERDRKIE